MQGLHRSQWRVSTNHLYWKNLIISSQDMSCSGGVLLIWKVYLLYIHVTSSSQEHSPPGDRWILGSLLAGQQDKHPPVILLTMMPLNSISQQTASVLHQLTANLHVIGVATTVQVADNQNPGCSLILLPQGNCEVTIVTDSPFEAAFPRCRQLGWQASIVWCSLAIILVVSPLNSNVLHKKCHEPFGESLMVFGAVRMEGSHRQCDEDCEGVVSTATTTSVHTQCFSSSLMSWK